MKTHITVLLTLLISISTLGQEITGAWNGLLNIQGQPLRLVFKISHVNGEYVATMDSPDQGAFDLPVSSVDYTNNTLVLKIPRMSLMYSGSYNGKTIVGVFTQGGHSFDMVLSRKEEITPKLKRPQTPKKPYSYHEENIQFQNQEDHITLAGTLTLPKSKGPHPAVILISGSGPQNRNEEILGHKPFLIIADYLTTRGIAVLRYDDRGTAASTGDFSASTSNDFARDVEWAFKYLRTRPEIIPTEIGLIGHSEGGIIAPMVSIHQPEVAFIILMAGPGVVGHEILLKQQQDIATDNGLTKEALEKSIQINKTIFEYISTHKKDLKFKKNLRGLLSDVLAESPLPKELTKSAFIDQQMAAITTPWFLNFLSYDPEPTLAKVTCPVLAINGAKDLQVNATVNLSAIKNTLRKSGNKNVTIKEYKDLNHLFQTCSTGNPSAYGTLQETFNPTVLEDILGWIQLQLATKK